MINDEDVWIVGVSMTPFGRYPDKDVIDLGSEAAIAALDDAGITINDIDVFASGNLYESMYAVGQRIQKQIGQTGIPVYNVANACAVVPGAEVEIWHVDAAGDYSQYGSQTAATFLRGIQTTNASGEVTFTTIYPGWYQGRATHIHVEVTMAGRSIKVTQMAFPESINNTVHTSGVYASRAKR